MNVSVSQSFVTTNCRFNRPVLTFLTVIGLVMGLKAQDYERKIEWTADKVYTFQNNKISQPDFVNAGPVSTMGMLPVYTEVFTGVRDGEASIQIVNPVYSTAGHIDNASLQFIKNEVDAKAQIAYYHKQPRMAVSILPFRKNAATGVIEKLESFTMRLNVAPKLQRRSLRTYAANSVLASGNWYKVAVSSEGVYKIDYNYLKQTLKLDPAGINLSKLAIFGNGGGMVPDLNSVGRPDDLLENPTYLVDNNGNNQFDQGDYLLFYGQMPDAWNYNSSTKTFSHTKNLYSDKTFYFLTTTNGTGKRIQAAQSEGSANLTVTDFDEHAYRDNDEYNLMQSGKQWLGDKMTSFSTTKSFSFNYANVLGSTPVTVKSYVGSTAPSGATITVNINGQNVITHSLAGLPGGFYPPAFIASNANGTYTASGSTFNVTYTFSPYSDPSGNAAGYIDWIELLFKRQLTLSGDAMGFRSIASVGTGNVSNFVLGNAGSSTQVWDVSSIGAIMQMPGTLNGSQLSFTATTDALREFMAVNVNGAFSNPEYVGPVSTQNLHALGQPAYIVVSYDDFLSASTDLVNYHKTSDNISGVAVPLSQIYNEFGSGKPDISAIRDFVKMFYDRAGGDTSKMPRYLLLMGDGSYDPKGRIANSSNYVPTYQSAQSIDQLSSYTSDDFYGLLDDNEGGDIGGTFQQMDVGVGRLPVESETEAADVVTKIKNYKKLNANCSTCAQVATSNSWRNVVTFVADYLYNGGTAFEKNSDYIAEPTRAQYPVYNYDKIYTDAYKLLSTPAGDRFPDVNAAILNRINSGTLVMNWIGHGGETNWSNARIFNMADIVQLQNQYLPLFITATCDFSRYDLPDRTAGEQLIVNPKGGAIASITTVRLVYLESNQTLNTAIFKYLFAPYNNRYPTLGEITMLTKNSLQSDITNMRKFTMLGDPALQLDYPRYDIATTMVNNKPISAAHDTLKALTQVTIKGEVRDDNGNKLTGFNGTIYPMVYDKISSVTTLNNDNIDATYTFNLYKNILFKGKASVTGGDFSFTFIVPKDINYQYGFGRISYYADNGSNLDANGYTNNIVVGGSSDTAHLSTVGPKMNIYMNDTKFVFGGSTNTSPMLLVELSDAGGINTAGNGVGHDLTAVLDDNAQNRIVLNDYYQSALNDFTKGEIRYPFTNLTEGRHNLKVKAWDIYNNSTEGYTEFIVTSNAKLALNHVYNYPNPFTTHTEFMFEHNRPCDQFNISVQIYTVSGKLVKSLVTQVQSTGYRVDGIEWDGLDDYGDPIGKGVYVYKLSVRDSEGNTAHKFEKLVLLR